MMGEAGHEHGGKSTMNRKRTATSDAGKHNPLIVLTETLILSFVISVSAFAAHPAVTLLDKDGDEINPILGENDDKPFSTAQTCGLCHDYDLITSGYHFQMGWDVVNDSFGVRSGKPWQISDGMMGKWCPFYSRQLAKKMNNSADEIDLAVYDFVGFSSGNGSPHPCGACHPGGGGLEYDRDGERYDAKLAENPGLAETLDGDYYKSRWDKSGVVEADCFVCHYKGYSFENRSYQLSHGNYQWAIVSGTGFGIVDGSVRRGDEPKVTYNKRFFDDDGTISLDVSWPPPDDNCVFCHGQTDARKRGFSWNDIHNPDIHNSQGISCSACHPSGPDHQFAKGNARAIHVADQLDGSIRTCEQCHEEGYLGATYPDHSKLRPSHVERIACEACHVPSLNRAAALGFEASTGELVFYLKPDSVSKIGDLGTWYPDYERWPDDVISPFNSVLLNWWGNLESGGEVYPLFLREERAAWKLYSDEVTDDNGDGKKEVNRREEIVAGLSACAVSLQENSRFTSINPVFVMGDRVYLLGDDGELVEGHYNTPPCVSYSISHNVAPARLALGANGCSDCHSNEANFFKGRRTVELFDVQGNPVTISNGRRFGCNPVTFAINTFHQQILSPVVSTAVIMVLFFLTLHYHSYGPKHVRFIPDSGEIKRFSFFERAIHLFRLISFSSLAVTGLIMAFNWYRWQDLLFSSPRQMHLIHIVSGFVFLVTTFIGFIIWFKDAIFTSYDKDWVRKLGGYLGYKGKVYSGRFNAGQKMFFWYTSAFGSLVSVTGVMLIPKSLLPLSWICLISTVHNLVAFIMISGVLSHAYLGTVANPGTWRVLVDGYVTREWARQHHPQWFSAVVRNGIEQDRSEIQEQE